jgi:hypothetical protein
VRDNGHGTEENWEFLPKLDVLADDDDALFARWVRETTPAYVGMSVCDECVDCVSSDARRAEPFVSWSEAIESMDELEAERAEFSPGSHGYVLRSLWIGDAHRAMVAAGGAS